MIKSILFDFVVYLRTIIGLRCKDGVILGAEKLITSNLLVEGTNRRIYNVDKHLGCVIKHSTKQIINTI